MFGAWGKSLADKNGLLTMRGLDWSVDGPFKEFHELTVYHNHDDTENTFLNIGWTGWVGSITGVNDKQLSIHEIGASFPDPSFGNESSIGIPFTYILRDILQFDKTRAEGNHRLATANRTCNLILGVGDGKEKRFNSVEYSHDVCVPITDTDFRVCAT
jgi:isopenicillin-N N-acyltransferase-like protein